jgi:hypothetical protein
MQFTELLDTDPLGPEALSFQPRDIDRGSELIC